VKLRPMVPEPMIAIWCCFSFDLGSEVLEVWRRRWGCGVRAASLMGGESWRREWDMRLHRRGVREGMVGG